MKGVRRSEEGFALFFVLMVGILIAVVGGAALLTSTQELGIAGSMRARAQAYYIAEAGAVKAQEYINRTRTYQDTMYLNVPFGGGTYTVLCQDSTKNPTLVGKQLLLLSTGKIGPAIRRLQVTLRKKTFNPGEVPGPLYIESPDPQFSGNVFTIQGADHQYGHKDVNDYIIGGDHRPAITTIHSAQSLIQALGSREDQVTSADSSGLFHPSYRANADTMDLYSLAASFAGPNGELADTINTIIGSYPDNYKVCYYNQSVTIAGGKSSKGAGVLVINGDLHISGQFEWTGIVIVLGEVEVTSSTDITGGGQGVHIWGTLLSRTIKFKISGQADIIWCSDAVRRASTPYERRASYVIGSIVEY